MVNFSNRLFKLKNLTLFCLLLLLAACASIQQPSGGPKDTQPPKLVKETPKNLSTNFVSDQIRIQFDEFIKLNNEFTEISISPAVEKMPRFKAHRQYLDIKFEAPLEKNTTYTINFGKAIVDVNEGNILRNYTYVFSTGNKIDSLSISGSVYSALTKESLKDVTVFLFPVNQDTLFGKKRPSIYTSTDSAGNFHLKNLREDKYFIYGLKEPGGTGDRIYNSINKEIAFLKDTLDLKKDITDIRLELFKEIPEKFKVSDHKIETNGRIALVFNKPLTTPTIQILEPKELDARKTVEINTQKDSALLWLPELTFDSLKIVVNEKAKALDTVKIFRGKKETYKREVIVTDNLQNSKLKPGTDVVLILSSPANSFDLSKIKLLEDSTAITNFRIVKDTTSIRKYLLKYSWKQGRQYTIKADENVFTDAFNFKSKPFTRNFSLDTEENYGNLSLAVTVPESGKNYLVELLTEQFTVLKKDEISKDTVLNYLRYPAGKYQIRVIYDENKNGQWDTGNVKERRQPEKVWNYDKSITLRPNWDIEEKMAIPKAP